MALGSRRNDCFSRLIVQVEGELIRYLVPIVRWISAHMPPPEGRNELLQIDSKVKEVVDVEESIWNSCYGFKAKIDCTLKANFF